MFNIFQSDPAKPEFGKEIHILNVMKNLSFIQINENDGLPVFICEACLTKAYFANEFKLQCQQAETDLQLRCQTIEIDFQNNIEFQIQTKPAIENNFIVNTGLNATLLPPNDETKQLNSYYTCDQNPVLFQQIVEKENVSVKTKISQIFQCEECNLQLDDRTSLDEHRNLAQHPAPRYACTLCNRSFARIYSLQYHLITHKEERAHLCPECGKRFHLASGLRQHLRSHSNAKPHSCPVCSKKYRSPQALREHIRVTHTDHRYTHTCQICGQKFTAKSSLTLHVKSHTGQKDHRCPHCPKAFTRVAYLRAHLRIHNGELPPRLYACSQPGCTRQFSAKASVAVHIRHAHIRERHYACEVCPKRFISASGLNDHRKAHSGERPEICDTCGARFVNKQTLKKHERLHTGERPYKCEQCDACFLSSSRLRDHEATRHGERQHECMVCGKRFHLLRVLRAHMLVHTDDRRSRKRILLSVPDIVIQDCVSSSTTSGQLPDLE